MYQSFLDVGSTGGWQWNRWSTLTVRAGIPLRPQDVNSGEYALVTARG
jgi:hypothetical protein